MPPKKGKQAKKGLAKKHRGKKKIIDPFLKKEWKEVRAPAVFDKHVVGQTIVNKTQGNTLSADSLRGRVFEVSQADLCDNAEDDAHRIFKLRVEEVQGNVCLTNFYGMRLSRDKERSICRKWQTLIEAHADIKTSDGFLLRVFTIAFTRKMDNQIKKTAYAQTSQVRAIRARMVTILEQAIGGQDLTSLVKLLKTAQIGKQIEEQCQSIFPLQNAFVRKIKVLRAPRLDMGRLLELHGGAANVASAAKDAGMPVEEVETGDDDMDEDAEW